MDALVSKTKEIFPDADDAELDAMLSAVREVAPNAGDEEILKVTKAVKDQQEKSAGARNYVKEKYGIGDQYSPEARQQIVQDNEAASSGGNAAAAFAALGAGLAGRDATSAGQAVLNNQKSARDSKLANFDKARDLAMSEKENAMSEEQKLARKDPNSELSKQMQQMAVEDYGMSPETAAKIPAEILEARLPALKYKAERADKAKDFAFKEADQAKDFAFKEKELGLKGEELANKKVEAGVKANSEKSKFDALAEDKKEIVTGLSKKNANKIAIANQIDSVLNNAQGLSENDQLQQYRQLIKTLNSSEGADAVGTDEAKRLASKLEFAFGNFSNDNPTQFGRDVKGFAEDAALTSKAMKDAVASNQATIDEAYGRKKSADMAETKVVKGVMYRKVPGGWEEVDKNAQVSN